MEGSSKLIDEFGDVMSRFLNAIAPGTSVWYFLDPDLVAVKFNNITDKFAASSKVECLDFRLNEIVLTKNEIMRYGSTKE